MKEIDGFIRLDPFHDTNRKNLNLDTIRARGFEGAVDVARERIFGFGVAYLYQEADSPTLGFAAIPNMPAHRASTPTSPPTGTGAWARWSASARSPIASSRA